MNIIYFAGLFFILSLVYFSNSIVMSFMACLPLQWFSTLSH